MNNKEDLLKEKEYYRKDAIFWEEKCNKFKDAYDKQKEMLIIQDKEMERLTLENKKLKSELESINQEIRKRMRK